jgi:hypothetical protein
MKRGGETSKQLAGHFEGGDEKGTREAVSVLPDPPIYEEPPVRVEIRPELSGPAELPPAKVSKNVRPEGCTCGELTTCIAHD